MVRCSTSENNYDSHRNVLLIYQMKYKWAYITTHKHLYNVSIVCYFILIICSQYPFIFPVPCHPVFFLVFLSCPHKTLAAKSTQKPTLTLDQSIKPIHVEMLCTLLPNSWV